MSVKPFFLNSVRKLFRNRFCENAIQKMIASDTYFSKFGQKIAPNYTLYRKNSIREFKRNGIAMEVDISDYIGHYIYFGYKDNSTQQLFELAKNQSVIIDIGANIGYTALMLAKLANPSAKVFAFEPDPLNFTKLKDNLGRNPDLTVYPENKGIGDRTEQLKLVVDTPNNLGGESNQ